MLLSLVVIGAFVLYVMNSDERDRLRRRLLSLQVTVIRLSANTLEAGAVLVRAFRARQFWARTAAAVLMMIALASVAGWTLIRRPWTSRVRSTTSSPPRRARPPPTTLRLRSSGSGR